MFTIEMAIVDCADFLADWLKGIMGIPYEGSILLGVYCTKVSKWMHRSRRLSASNLNPECNKHSTILNLNIVFPLLDGITKKIVTEKRFIYCHVIVGDNIIFSLMLTIRVNYEMLRL